MPAESDQSQSGATGDSMNEKYHERTDAPFGRSDNGQLLGSEKPDKHEKKEEQAQKKDDGGDKQPAGGYDDTPIPRRPPGYTLKFTFHNAANLAIGDVNSLSSDPYALAQLNTDNPTRHKEDPYLRYRTKTVQKDRAPVWDEEWIVANVPASGFKLKVHILDEDPADKDDLLGRVSITVPSLQDGWEGIHKETYTIKVSGSSWRAYTFQALTTCMRDDKSLRGDLTLSIEMLGRTEEDGQNGRLYTVGPCRWIRHYSPILGRLTGTQDPNVQKAQGQSDEAHKKQVQRYNFQANQIQLRGPVPPELYHRFVEFKPWVKRMFTSSGLSGMVLGKALHHQHTRVYNFGRSTVRGTFEKPSEDLTRQFLDLVHYDEGGRIYTYVLTLDALWRFTETGKEFGIDMLSKHTMHSDVSIYIAFSGEFFIRRLKHPRRPPPPDPVEESSQSHPPEHADNPEHPPKDVDNGPPDDDPPKDPQYYELVIDNDSGTYRPNAKLLPLLKDFFARSLPGLHILTLDCQADADKMGKMKQEQRDRKKAEGQNIVYTQRRGSNASSISSSDEEDLDAIQAGLDDTDDPQERSALKQTLRDAKIKQKGKVDKARRNYGLGHDEANEASPAEGSASQ